MTRRQRPVRVTVVIVLVVAAFLGWKQYEESHRERAFIDEMLAHGTLVVGKVTRDQKEVLVRQDRRVTIPTATVTYEVRGAPYSLVMNCLYDRCPLPGRSTVNIWVDPDDPAVLVTEDGFTGHRFDDTGRAYLFMAVAVLLAGGMLVFMLVVTDRGRKSKQAKGPVL